MEEGQFEEGGDQEEDYGESSGEEEGNYNWLIFNYIICEDRNNWNGQKWKKIYINWYLKKNGF